MTEHAAWAEIDTRKLVKNLAVIRSRINSNVRICAVMKADAYGHGLSGLVKEFAMRGFTDMIGLGKFQELLEISNEPASEKLELILLGVAAAGEIAQALDAGRIIPRRTIFSAYSMDMIRELDSVAERAKVCLRVHVRIDPWNSGMGLSMMEFMNNEDEIFRLKHLEVCGLYSHLYTAYSEETDEIESTLRRFSDFVENINKEYREQLTVHVLNSSLTFRFPEYAFDMVRCGTAIYGLQCWDEGTLQPLMRICARIFDVKDVSPATPLSYISGAEEGKSRRIARIMMGVWDCPILLSLKDVRIHINGRLYGLADDVCMDNLCVDITGADDIKVGDTAVLMGEDGVTLGEILDRNDISFVHGEGLCMTARRLKKVYI